MMQADLSEKQSPSFGSQVDAGASFISSTAHLHNPAVFTLHQKAYNADGMQGEW